MFPTHVGMNRSHEGRILPPAYVPHTCGDEPVFRTKNFFLRYVFPTYVGMNPQLRRQRLIRILVPHVRGDEPLTGAASPPDQP